MNAEFDTLVKDILGESEPGEPTTDFPTEYDRFYEAVRNHLMDLGPSELRRLQTEGDMRFSTALPVSEMRNSVIALVGCGGLGNHIWRILLGMGFRLVHIFDDDVVEAVNVGPQMHRIVDIGLPKVECARNEALAFRGLEIEAHNMRVNNLSEIVREIGRMPDVLIGATDSAEFRNSVIGDFLLETSCRQLPLFIDLRMALGDWNAFCFTPRALKSLGGFDEGTQLRKAYDRYVELAVFPREEAVQEPCTERAIVYTGACVAGFVGAYLGWWFKTGMNLVSTVGGLTQYYRDEVEEGNFCWMTRFSSSDFHSETMTSDLKKKVRDAAVGVSLKNAVVREMSRVWNGSNRMVPGETTDPVGPGTGATLAFLDRNGDMHVRKTYAADPTLNWAGDDYIELAATLDLNLTSGQARMCVDMYRDEDKWLPTLIEQRERLMVSPPAHVEFLESGHAASVMMSMGRLSDKFNRVLVDLFLARTDNSREDLAPFELWERAENSRRPLCCVVVDLGDHVDTTIAVRLVGQRYDRFKKMFVWSMEAFKTDSDVRAPVRISTASLPNELAEMRGSTRYCTGWARYSDDLLMLPLGYHDEDEGLNVSLGLDMTTGYEALMSALCGPGGEAMIIRDVPDGATVCLANNEAYEYSKASEDGAMLLVNAGGDRIRVSPYVRVRVLKW